MLDTNINFIHLYELSTTSTYSTKPCTQAFREGIESLVCMA